MIDWGRKTINVIKINKKDERTYRLSGRVPASVLARHYSDYSPEVFKEIYDNIGLKISKKNDYYDRKEKY
jgi:hypothetical protein